MLIALVEKSTSAIFICGINDAGCKNSNQHTSAYGQ
jgi:hypothetical protein